MYGGISEERGVSSISAATVAAAVGTKNRVVPIAIDPHGGWYLQPHSVVGAVPVVEERTRVSIVPARGLSVAGRALPVDVVFPVVHGKQGEDGVIQGALEVAGLPYVGSGVCASAVGMHKGHTKALWERAGLPVVPYCVLRCESMEDNAYAGFERRVASCAERWGWPLFVKPARSGSSAGISKLSNVAQLRGALHTAMQFDDYIMVEKGIIGREIEYAVVGNDTPYVSEGCEIVPGHDFYDYSAKYLDTKSTKVVIPARIPPALNTELQKVVAHAYAVSEASGLARVDLLLDASERYYLSEINTMPGFTESSAFPRLWKAEGRALSEVIEDILDYAERQHLKRARFRRPPLPN